MRRHVRNSIILLLKSENLGSRLVTFVCCTKPGSAPKFMRWGLNFYYFENQAPHVGRVVNMTHPILRFAYVHIAKSHSSTFSWMLLKQMQSDIWDSSGNVQFDDYMTRGWTCFLTQNVPCLFLNWLMREKKKSSYTAQLYSKDLQIILPPPPPNDSCMPQLTWSGLTPHLL